MALAVKALGGILGGGTAVVGGCGVYSTVTGKPILFFKGSEKASSQSGDQQTVTDQPASGAQDSPTSNEQEQKQKFKTLLSTVKNGCEIKVKETNGSLKAISESENNNLESLNTVLEKFKSGCEAQSTDKTEKIIKNSSETWEEINDKEYIDELIKGWSQKCTIKVRNNQVNKEISTITNNEEVKGLYGALKERKTDCGSNVTAPSTPKVFVYKKDSSSDSWSIVSEKDQIKELISAWSKCTLKIKIGSTNKTIDQIVDTTDDISDLYDEVEKKKGDCTSGSKQITLIFHKQSNSWVPMDEKAKIKDLMESVKDKCTLKIKKDATTDGVELDNLETGVSLEGLYEQLETDKVTESCASQQPKTDLVYQKESGDKQWKKIAPTTPAA